MFKKTQAQVFSYEICEMFENTSFKEHFRTTAFIASASNTKLLSFCFLLLTFPMFSFWSLISPSLCFCPTFKLILFCLSASELNYILKLHTVFHIYHHMYLNNKNWSHHFLQKNINFDTCQLNLAMSNKMIIDSYGGSAFHPSEVDKMSTRKFWELNGKK